MRRASPSPAPAAAPPGPRPTLEEVIRDHLPLLTGCVSRTLSAPYVKEDVEEVVADALLAIHDALPDYDPSRRIQAWIYRIAQRKALDRRRHDARGGRVWRRMAAEEIGPDGLNGFADKAPNAEELMARHELRALLDAFLRALPEGEREILDMRLSGLSLLDMVEALGESEGTVRSRVRRAEAALAQVAKRHQAEQRRRRGVAVLPLVMSDLLERVGAASREVPEGMRERVTERLRLRLGGARPAPRLPALRGRVSGGVAGVVGGIAGGLVVALVALVLILLALRRPGPAPVATAGAPASAPVATASFALAAAPVAAPASASILATVSDAPNTAAPDAGPLRGAPVVVSPLAQRRALVRAFNRAMDDGKREEACTKLRDDDAHHFADARADIDRAAMLRACDPAKP